MPKTPQIFISYVRADKERVEPLYHKLAQAGFKPWMDTQDVFPGEQWRLKIAQAIRSADFFLACLSPNSISKRGFLQKEIRQALDAWHEKLPDDIYLIPVRLEDCAVPDSLADFHWVDLFEKDGWTQLLHSIQVATDRREATAEPAAPLAPMKEAHARGAKPARAPRPPRVATSTPSEPLSATLPIMTFPRDLSGFLRRVAAEPWERLDEDTRRFLVTLGTKLEPMVQIVPPTPVPYVIGFESLALGSLGENFAAICKRAGALDPALLRLTLTLAAFKTISSLRTAAAQEGNTGAHHLLFTTNLDPEMLECPLIEDFLDRNYYHAHTNILFEVNERTTLRCLQRLKDLQVDFNLRYCADDFNNWKPRVREALAERVEMTKLDHRRFQEAMRLRGDDPERAVELIAAHKIAEIPLVVEGVEDRNHLRFLREHWPFERTNHLFGQGYIIEPGHPWDEWVTDLRVFGLPGGHFLEHEEPATRR